MFTQKLQTACKRTALVAAMVVGIANVLPGIQANGAQSASVNNNQKLAQTNQSLNPLSDIANKTPDDEALNAMTNTSVIEVVTNLADPSDNNQANIASEVNLHDPALGGNQAALDPNDQTSYSSNRALDDSDQLNGDV